MGLVEQELREVEEVQRLRGDAGERLKQWGAQGDAAVEGREYAKKVFLGLRKLGGERCAFEVLNKGLVLTQYQPGDDDE